MYKGSETDLNRLGSLSGEAHEFGIPGDAIRADAVGLEPALHVHLARLVKCQAALLHDLEHLGLGRIIESRAGVSILDVAAQVKRATRQAGLNIACETVGQPRVDVACAWEVRDVRDPARAGEEERRGDDDEEDGDGVENVTHGVGLSRVADKRSGRRCFASRGRKRRGL